MSVWLVSWNRATIEYQVALVDTILWRGCCLPAKAPCWAGQPSLCNLVDGLMMLNCWVAGRSL